MGGNRQLHAARRARQDEFYTQRDVIEEELRHYTKHFTGKTVYLNCDDPYESEFFKYFALKFNSLKLERLIATSYAGSPIAGSQMTFDDIGVTNSGRAHRVDIRQVDDYTGNGAVDMADVDWLLRNDANTARNLTGGGDFRSSECIELLAQADIVVTNPPFSLFREYVAQLMEREKKFVILGNMNAVTYKEVHPLFKEDRIWYGPSISSGDREFGVPPYYPLTAATSRVDENGNKFIRVKGVRWFTNLDHKKRHEELPLFRRYHRDPGAYPAYDNYDAINVDRVRDIPEDYDGVMGVPITFLDKYNPQQFEIVRFRKGDDGKDLRVGAKEPYFRILIRRRKQ
ncbi:MAG: modification methylase [Chloroflexi bacterium]|nr:modification methylase [Chloroflexota bacterium]